MPKYKEEVEEAVMIEDRLTKHDLEALRLEIHQLRVKLDEVAVTVKRHSRRGMRIS